MSFFLYANISTVSFILFVQHCTFIKKLFSYDTTLSIQKHFAWYHKNHSDGYGKYRFKEVQKQKASSTTTNTKYYSAANTQEDNQQPNNTITLKDALEHLQEEYSLVNKIADTILDNELASNSQRDYSTDQLVHTIKQKYYPPASDNQINSVL